MTDNNPLTAKVDPATHEPDPRMLDRKVCSNELLKALECLYCGTEYDLLDEGRCPYCGNIPADCDLWSKGETRKRLQAAKAELQRVDRNWPAQGKHEVQTRVLPGAARTKAEAFEMWDRLGRDERDDLNDISSWQQAPRESEHRRRGALVHIMVSHWLPMYESYDLYDVRVVWLGYEPEDEPVVLDRRMGDRITAATRKALPREQW